MTEKPKTRLDDIPCNIINRKHPCSTSFLTVAFLANGLSIMSLSKIEALTLLRAEIFFDLVMVNLISWFSCSWSFFILSAEAVEAATVVVADESRVERRGFLATEVGATETSSTLLTASSFFTVRVFRVGVLLATWQPEMGGN